MKSRLDRNPSVLTREDLPASARDDFDLDAVETESDEPADLGHIVGSTTGEPDRDTVAGGWAGTDDATSTAPSDLDPTFSRGLTDGGPEDDTIPELTGGVGVAHAITDIKGTPVDESRDWETDPIVGES